MNQMWHTYRKEWLQLEGRRKGIATLLVEGPGIELSEELPLSSVIASRTSLLLRVLYAKEFDTKGMKYAKQ